MFIEFTLSALYEVIAEQTKHQVEHQVKHQVELTDIQFAVLSALKNNPLSRKEIFVAIEVAGDSRAFRRHIEPLLTQGFIEMPNSRLQKYRLTEAGKTAAGQ